MARVALIALADEYCLGLRHLAGYLDKRGHDVHFVVFLTYTGYCKDPETVEAAGTADGESMVQVVERGEVRLALARAHTQQDVEALLGVLGDFAPDVVGITVSSFNLGIARELTEAIRDRLPTRVAWGGIHPTADPEECFQGDAGSPDAICLGEGEMSFDDYLQAVDRGEDPAKTDIPGLWTVSAAGEVQRNPNRSAATDIAPYAWQFHDTNRETFIEGGRALRRFELPETHLTFAYKVLASRGCPCHCSFCANSLLHSEFPELRHVRFRPPRDVIDELLHARETMPHLALIEFYDEVFLIRNKWFREFAELYKREIALPFWCCVHPNFVSEETVDLAVEMGLQHVVMGVQSGSNRINREVFDRPADRERVIASANILHERGVRIYYDFITNNPYETEEDRFDTLDLITRLPGDFSIQMAQLAWLPATALTRRARRENMIGKVDAQTYRFWNALYLLASHHIGDAETLKALVADEHLRSDPRFLWDVLRNVAVGQAERDEIDRLRYETGKLREEAEQARAALARLEGRRAVRAAARLADGLKKLAGGDREDS